MPYTYRTATGITQRTPSSNTGGKESARLLLSKQNEYGGKTILPRCTACHVNSMAEGMLSVYTAGCMSILRSCAQVINDC